MVGGADMGGVSHREAPFQNCSWQCSSWFQLGGRRGCSRAVRAAVL